MKELKEGWTAYHAFVAKHPKLMEDAERELALTERIAELERELAVELKVSAAMGQQVKAYSSELAEWKMLVDENIEADTPEALGEFFDGIAAELTAAASKFSALERELAEARKDRDDLLSWLQRDERHANDELERELADAKKDTARLIEAMKQACRISTNGKLSADLLAAIDKAIEDGIDDAQEEQND